jgi:hypothetical protein
MCSLKSAIDCFLMDKENLFRVYESMDTIGFEEFAKCWTDAKFSLILYGRRMRVFRDWLPACYTSVLPDLGQFHPVNRRVFTLYLLYGMFFRQPLQQSIPIRMPLHVWQDMDELRHYAVRENALPVLFVWHKLISSGGIQFVYSLPFYGPLQAKTSVKDSSLSLQQRLRVDLQSELEPPLADLIHLNEQYESMKRDIAASDPDIQDLVPHPGSGTFSDFREKLQSGKLTETQSPVKQLNAGGDEDIGEKRRRLKSGQLCIKN